MAFRHRAARRPATTCVIQPLPEADNRHRAATAGRLWALDHVGETGEVVEMTPIEFDPSAPLPPLTPFPRNRSWEPAVRRYRDLEPGEHDTNERDER